MSKLEYLNTGELLLPEIKTDEIINLGEKMTPELTTVLVALITSLFSAGGWAFFKHRHDLKKKSEEILRKDNNLFRDDLRERVIKLEAKIDDCEGGRESLMKEMISVRESLAEFKTRVSFLESHAT